MMTSTDAAVATDKKFLQYNIQFTETEAKFFIKAAGPYNEATPNRLLTLIEDIKKILPEPEFGPSFLYRIGREYSRVLYVEAPDSWMPEGAITPEIISRLEEAGKKAKADEACLVSEKFWFKFRFWWD